ncbi:hypothetical protein bcgnr5369_03360 [Bacillus cereus]|uniref:MBL fold metallo-hydrolase n=2 Tax=Bacillus thuringiensis TaxID=1428 RepID=A0A9X6WSM2_BACTU|nr:MBL fold metallo-hydrolase [Bacillus thuringiensis]
MEMKLTFLNAGDAFAFEQGHNSALLEFDNTNLVIDFPATNRAALRKLGMDLGDVENVFITHLHEDHINGIQQFAYFNKFVTGRKPNLYIAEDLVDGLWETVRQGLLYGVGALHTIEDYFVVKTLKQEQGFVIDDIEFGIVKTKHFEGMSSYGLLAKKYFYFSGDSLVDYDFLTKIHPSVQTIFHDVHLKDINIPVHASVKDIKKLPQEIQEKIFIMHYHDEYVDKEKRERFEKEKNVQIAYALQQFVF